MKLPGNILSSMLILLLCFILLPFNTSPSFAKLPPLQDSISMTYSFPVPEIEVTGQVESLDAYVSVTMAEVSQWSEAGLPVLPFKTAKLLLPYGAKVTGIEVTYGKKISLPGSYLVEPGQEPVPLSRGRVKLHDIKSLLLALIAEVNGLQAARINERRVVSQYLFLMDVA